MTRTVALALAAAPLLAFAQEAPRFVISHQGFLTDADDNPLSGSHTVTLSLYDKPQKPTFGTETPKWTDTFTVTLFRGRYALALGETPGEHNTALTAAVFGAGEARWMAISVDGGAEMEPRIRVGQVPLAMYADAAGNADKLDDLDSSAFAPAAIQGDVTSILTKATAIEASVGTGLDSDVAALQSDVDGIASAVTGLGSALGAAAGDLGIVKTSVGTDLKGAVAAVDGKATGLATDLGNARTEIAGVKTDVGNVATNVGNARTDIGNARTEIGTVQATLGTGTGANSVQSKLDSIVLTLGQIKELLAPTACPAGMMLMAGGTRRAYCIDVNENAVADYDNANRLCTAAGKRLCTAEEWMGACGVTGMNNMTGNLEYVSPIFHTHSHGTASMTIGQVDCGQSSGISQADNYNATYNYRCCR